MPKPTRTQDIDVITSSLVPEDTVYMIDNNLFGDNLTVNGLSQNLDYEIDLSGSSQIKRMQEEINELKREINILKRNIEINSKRPINSDGPLDNIL